MHGLIAWLSGLPVAVLYLVLAIAAALENVFPPVPADTVVALGSWLAARGQGSAILAFLAPVLGNIAGAAGMYFVGRAHGAAWIHRRFPALGDVRHQERLAEGYGRHGVTALVLSRFIPGLRALVPPFAGAMKVPAGRAIAAMSVASFVWYGTISYLAYRAGADWDALSHAIRRSGTIVATGAAILLVLALVAWRFSRRRQAGEAA